jgi:hypothetical protein
MQIPKFYTHSSIGRYLDCFQFGIIINKVAIGHLCTLKWDQSMELKVDDPVKVLSAVKNKHGHCLTASSRLHPFVTPICFLVLWMFYLLRLSLLLTVWYVSLTEEKDAQISGKTSFWSVSIRCLQKQLAFELVDWVRKISAHQGGWALFNPLRNWVE